MTEIQKPKASSGYTDTGSTHVSGGSANGRAIEIGPRGGHSYVNSNGNRTYVQPSSYSSTGTSYVSSGSANGSTVYEGSRGGNFVFTSGGNKRYI